MVVFWIEKEALISSVVSEVNLGRSSYYWLRFVSLRIMREVSISSE